MESDAWAPQVLWLVTGLGIWGSTITDLLMIRMIRSSNLTLMYSIHRLYQTRQFLIWRRNTQIFISRQRIPLMKADLGMSKAKGEFFYTIFARWSNKTSCRPSKDPIPPSGRPAPKDFEYGKCTLSAEGLVAPLPTCLDRLPLELQDALLDSVIYDLPFGLDEAKNLRLALIEERKAFAITQDRTFKGRELILSSAWGVYRNCGHDVDEFGTLKPYM